MNITEPYLDFSDVLIRPKRSNAVSREQIRLDRTYHFRNGSEWSGVPIMASNMDTTGTFAMSKALAKQKMITCLHKYYTEEELVDKLNETEDKCLDWGVPRVTLTSSTFQPNYTWLTIGTNYECLAKLEHLIKKYSNIKGVCVDVANGHTDNFVKNCREVREIIGNRILMAGNVATPEMVQELVLTGGVDIVKCGIGPGCFRAGTPVKVPNGHRPIEQVREGDLVYTDSYSYKRVVGLTDRIEKKKLIVINGYECTETHEFLTYSSYTKTKNGPVFSTEWIPAWLITKQHKLVGPDGVSQPVKSVFIKHLEESVRVYDLEVEHDHSYCVGELIVHNSACTTRSVTGVGVPQLSCIMECADAAHGLGAHICADGGCKEPGDVVKAFAAGADFVMLGGMLAGTDECEGEWVYDGKPTKTTICPTGKVYDVKYPKAKKAMKFYGMASLTALQKYGKENNYRPAEGKTIEIPYKGPVSSVLQQLTGGLKSACSYVGARELKDLSKCTTFIRTK
jgi:IMP dehydrogenase/GMP reductase